MGAKAIRKTVKMVEATATWGDITKESEEMANRGALKERPRSFGKCMAKRISFPQ